MTSLTGEQLFAKLGHLTIGGTTCLYTEEKCAELAPLINEINQLKAEKNAVILAHSYVSPEILVGVADFVGDSYELSKNAKQTTAERVVFAAVKFMAETAKILNPTKTVLIPSRLNGCSLADSITGDQVLELRKTYPDYTFVCYINTTADVKAACDVCVTSSNVTKIIKAIPNDKIYFLPDKLMAKNVITELKEAGIHKTIKYWDGTCYVHEEYDPDMIRYVRAKNQDVKVLSHPECTPEVLAESDFVGSTTQIRKEVLNSEDQTFFILSECGLGSRLQLERPDKTFVGSCTMCKYMKSNTLEDIKRVLVQPEEEDIISIPAETIKKAEHCISEMFRYTEENHPQPSAH